jgi:hypothetical protein
VGILYTVWPLDAEAREWLTSEGISFPDGPSRWPTRSELEKVLGELRGFSVDYTVNGASQRWDASVDDGDEDGNWTLLHAEPQDDDSCTKVSFEKGEPTLIVAILRSLSADVGPLMLLPDVGCPPMVVSTSRSVQDIVADFCEIEEDSPKWQRLLQNAPGAAPVQ